MPQRGQGSSGQGQLREGKQGRSGGLTYTVLETLLLLFSLFSSLPFPFLSLETETWLEAKEAAGVVGK